MTTHALDGSADGAATDSGALSAGWALAAVAAGLATTLGSLAVSWALTALAQGMSTTTGTLAVQHSLAGAAAGTSSASAGLAVGELPRFILLDGSAWKYRQKITVDSDGITLSGNIAAPHNLHIDNNARWTGGDSFWAHVSSVLGNIAFTASDKGTVLPHCVKTWDYAGQDASIDVLHTWSSSADTVIYLYYGYVSGGTYPKGATYFVTAYDSSFAAVYSMDDGADTSHCNDIKGNGHTGTKTGAANPAVATGKSGKAQSFDGSTSAVACGTTMPTWTNFTFAAWINATAFPTSGTLRDLMGNYSSAANNGAHTDFYNASGTQQWRVEYNGVTTVYNHAMSAGTWYHIAVVHNASADTDTFYVNGAQVSSTGSKTTNPIASTYQFDIGNWQEGGGQRYFYGLIDEVHLSNTPRSLDFLKVEYQSVNKQDDWGTVGTNYLQADTAELPDNGLLHPWIKNAGNPILAPAVAWEGTNTDEPSVVYEWGTYKMWYRGSGSATTYAVGYATSSDGVTWTKYASNPVLSDAGNGITLPDVFKVGSTYHCYAWHKVGAGSPTLDHWTSSDGITWALDGTCLTLTGSEIGFGNNYVFVDDDGIWKMLYEYNNSNDSNFDIALATSPSGLAGTWTRYGSNPVLDITGGSAGGPFLHKIGSTYYLWVHVALSGTTPTDLYLYTSTDLYAWTQKGNVPNLWRELTWETNQVADALIVEVAGTTYLYYDAVNGTTEQIGMASAPYTLSQMLESGTAQALIGESGGSGTVTASLTVSHNLSSESDGTAVVTGALAVTHPLAGSTDGASTATCSLTLAYALAGQATGTSAADANLSTAYTGTTQQLSASADGTSITVGALAALHTLAGTAGGTSATSADLTTSTTGTAQHLAGQVDGASTATGALAVVHPLAVTSTGTSAADASLARGVHMAAQADGASAADSTLTRGVNLSGSADGLATTAGAIVMSWGLSAQSDGQSSMTATLNATYALAGTAAGLGNVGLAVLLINNLTYYMGVSMSQTGVMREVR